MVRLYNEYSMRARIGYLEHLIMTKTDLCPFGLSEDGTRSTCLSGFPGCACADWLMAHEEMGDDCPFCEKGENQMDLNNLIHVQKETLKQLEEKRLRERCITVGDLIEALEKCPRDAGVVFMDEDGFTNPVMMIGQAISCCENWLYLLRMEHPEFAPISYDNRYFGPLDFRQFIEFDEAVDDDDDLPF